MEEKIEKILSYIQNDLDYGNMDRFFGAKDGIPVGGEVIEAHNGEEIDMVTRAFDYIVWLPDYNVPTKLREELGDCITIANSFYEIHEVNGIFVIINWMTDQIILTPKEEIKEYYEKKIQDIKEIEKQTKEIKDELF